MGARSAWCSPCGDASTESMRARLAAARSPARDPGGWPGGAGRPGHSAVAGPARPGPGPGRLACPSGYRDECQRQDNAACPWRTRRVRRRRGRAAARAGPASATACGSRGASRGLPRAKRAPPRRLPPRARRWPTSRTPARPRRAVATARFRRFRHRARVTARVAPSGMPMRAETVSARGRSGSFPATRGRRSRLAVGSGTVERAARSSPARSNLTSGIERKSSFDRRSNLGDQNRPREPVTWTRGVFTECSTFDAQGG